MREMPHVVSIYKVYGSYTGTGVVRTKPDAILRAPDAVESAAGSVDAERLVTLFQTAPSRGPS
jgi:hypothetical protein